jgi:hypothetical protein
VASIVESNFSTHFWSSAWAMSSWPLLGTSPAVDCGGTSPVDRPNMLSRSAAKLWAMELGLD